MRAEDSNEPGVAFTSYWTRKRLAADAAKGLMQVALALVLFFLGALFLEVDGGTRPGVPEFVPLAFLIPAVLLGVLGLLVIFNASRMSWVLARYPWRHVVSTFEEIDFFLTPNGQPVLFLDEGDKEFALTLVAAKWRWSRFAHEPRLLIAGRPGRGSVVAAPARPAIAWAGRSPVAAVILWWKRRQAGR